MASANYVTNQYIWCQLMRRRDWRNGWVRGCEGAQSHDGKAKVDQVARAIQKLTAGSSRLQALVREVSEGTRQQSDGLAQIAKAVKEMDRSTQTASESAREGAAAAAELDEQARGLREMVASLESADRNRGPWPSRRDRSETRCRPAPPPRAAIRSGACGRRQNGRGRARPSRHRPEDDGRR